MERIVDLRVGLDMTTEDCCNCGVVFAMPTSLRTKLLETGHTFYCPNGHPQHFAESTEAKLRKAQERLREQTAYSTSLSKQLDGALKQVSIKKGVITKMKKRVQAGVCTECHRHFEDLQRHMETKHPGAANSK